MTVHSSFYNDFDPNACRWLDNLQRHHKIPEGVVSSMSITNITEVGDYQYAHFFCRDWWMAFSVPISSA